MTTPAVATPRNRTSSARVLADQAFSRAAGAPLVSGNSVRLLKDASENYPAWLDAINSARQVIHFESYIIHEDEWGRSFADALAARARSGVRVRVLYDWLGGLGVASGRFWRSLRAAGVEVRCFNPPRLDSPIAWLNRDHRKAIVVDGRLGFVTGLCVGRMWVGDPARGVEPWRDTGVEIRGPAVADIDQAFADVWSSTGRPLPADEVVEREDLSAAGAVMLRVIASAPSVAGVYRLDQLIAAIARKALWLTDAYFVGTTPYVQALRAAAEDGVDVRLLVPGSSDLSLIRPLSRAGYRPLLEAGVRVFEWNGPMLHAKTAVADGQWARVGSSNLNIASWIGNYELDVAIDDGPFAQEMEVMYEEDLTRATEIVLTKRRHARRLTRAGESKSRRLGRSGRAGRAVAGALSVGSTVGAAMTNRRVLGPVEAAVMIPVSLFLITLAVVAVEWPRVVAIPLAVFSAWIAVSLIIRTVELWRRPQTEKPSDIGSSS